MNNHETKYEGALNSFGTNLSWVANDVYYHINNNDKKKAKYYLNKLKKFQKDTCLVKNLVVALNTDVEELTKLVKAL